MQTSIVRQRLAAYREWKLRVTRAVLELGSWLEAEEQTTPESRGRIRHILDVLDKDRLTIAFVAELSRGKTELINAIFFADFGHRLLLPSTAGRTTMCSTELLWDEARSEAYLRLLPIETRAQDVPIAQIKSDPKQWVHYPLRMQDTEQMTATLNEILHTKKVSMAEATRLCLSTFGLTPEGQPSASLVEIPKWRHAIVSFPHPLLKQVLVDALEADVGQHLERNRTRISTRIGHAKSQLQELEQLREKSDDVIGYLLEKTRREQEQYVKGVHRFQASRDELIVDTRLSRRHQTLPPANGGPRTNSVRPAADQLRNLDPRRPATLGGADTGAQAHDGEAAGDSAAYRTLQRRFADPHRRPVEAVC